MSQSRPSAKASPHSAEYFGPQRDFWWNSDFLNLLADRWKLAEAESLADIGCGLGHWSRLLFRYLPSRARILGVDKEAAWVEQARRLFVKAYPATSADRATFLKGDAAAIPAASDSFDVVTCQTLLIHLPSPESCLQEMVRVAKPGGLIAAVEPNNLFNMLALDSVTLEGDTEALTRSFEFWLRYQQGKCALGEGDNSLGELLPGMFAQAGLNDIRVYLRDTTFALYPPYAQEQQNALLEQERLWRETETGLWDYDQILRYVLAGGGSKGQVDDQLGYMRGQAARRELAIHENQYSAAGGGLVYIVSGRKR